MAPRGFDRMMIAIELSSNAKVARLTNAEFRCLITGVWALAAKAKPRGYLVVAGLPANADDVAHQGRCSAAVAKSTLAKMRQLVMLELVEEVGLEYCHDWHELNPDPKKDDGAAKRKREQRDRERADRDSHAGVTP